MDNGAVLGLATFQPHLNPPQLGEETVDGRPNLLEMQATSTVHQLFLSQIGEG